MTQSIHIGKIWHPAGGLFGKGDKISPQGDLSCDLFHEIQKNIFLQNTWRQPLK